jgi:hypothetical protein
MNLTLRFMNPPDGGSILQETEVTSSWANVADPRQTKIVQHGALAI